MQENLQAAGAPPQTPQRELTAYSADLADGEEGSLLLLKNPNPNSAFQTPATVLRAALLGFFEPCWLPCPTPHRVLDLLYWSQG